MRPLNPPSGAPNPAAEKVHTQAWSGAERKQTEINYDWENPTNNNRQIFCPSPALMSPQACLGQPQVTSTESDLGRVET